MKLTIVLVILLATVSGAVCYGRTTRKGHTMADWAVGGRSLGTVIFWFMNAGEVYTTFAVLGISGYAWALGAPAYLAFCSVSLSYALGYWLMPKIWRAGRAQRLMTQADFFAKRYDARWLGILTGAIGIASLIVYVQIQLGVRGWRKRRADDRGRGAAVRDDREQGRGIVDCRHLPARGAVASGHWPTARTRSHFADLRSLAADVGAQHCLWQLGVPASVPDLVHVGERHRDPP